MKNRLTLQYPVGELVLTEEDAKITRLCLPGENPPSDFQEQHTPSLDRAAQELEEYFAGKRKQFDLPLNPAGTEFQHRVWQELEKIPIISLEKNTSTRRYMDDFLAQNQVVIQPEFELATSDMIVQFALKNLGVGCVVKDFAKEYVDAGLLFELRFNKIIPKRHFSVVLNRKTPLSVAAQKLLEVMKL